MWQNATIANCINIDFQQCGSAVENYEIKCDNIDNDNQGNSNIDDHNDDDDDNWDNNDNNVNK